ncbi:MAG: phosphodiester glycosidase family protein [Acidobacteria bacterium]|nr:phosphodiester glycosidase family protein [Acidobacteriota bacterium]
MRIDLKAKGISLYSSPQSGPLDTIATTTSAFLMKNHLQVAINSGFFDPCCKAVAEPKDVMGLAISQGQLVSHPSSTSSYDVALVIRHGEASIAHVSPVQSLKGIETAIAGSAIIVQDGRNNDTVNKLHGADVSNPRTVIGLSKDHQYLYFVVIDGRKPGYSIGTTNVESAEIMLKIGAFTAMNVDGGGSTAMIKDDGKGGFITVNKPSGGKERWDAIQLGVRAMPLRK